MARIATASRIALIASVVLLAVAALIWGNTVELPGSVRYYRGESLAATTATAGPIRVRVKRAIYDADTRLDLELTNGSQDTLLLIRRDVPTAEPGQQSDASLSYYLLDSGGMRYPTSGTGSRPIGWTMPSNDPAARYGEVLAGSTVEFSITFPPIPSDAGELSLVMEDVATDGGQSYDIRVPVPIP